MAEPFLLIVISPEYDLPGEEDRVTRLFEKGLQLYHLRKPGWTLSQAEHFLKAIPKTYHSRIVVHSHFHLAAQYALRGIHLNEENKKNAALFKQYKVVSASFHSPDSIQAEKFAYEYVFLSPIFDSISKPGYKTGFDFSILQEHLRMWKGKRNPLKIIALGGIQTANISVVKQMGFSGAAVLGAIWNSHNPVETFLSLQNAMQAEN